MQLAILVWAVQLVNHVTLGSTRQGGVGSWPWSGTPFAGPAQMARPLATASVGMSNIVQVRGPSMYLSPNLCMHALTLLQTCINSSSSTRRALQSAVQLTNDANLRSPSHTVFAPGYSGSACVQCASGGNSTTAAAQVCPFPYCSHDRGPTALLLVGLNTGIVCALLQANLPNCSVVVNSSLGNIYGCKHARPCTQ